MISTTRVAVAHSDIRCGLCGSPYSAHNWTLSGSTLQGACPAESESELRRLGYTLRADLGVPDTEWPTEAPHAEKHEGE
jgi:hypothetical protein